MASRLSPLQILDEARAGGIVLEDFKPLAESLEWELGQQYWLEQGSQAFVGSEPVPFVINNDGNLSIRVAEVFFTSLVEAEKVGKLEDDIFVLELGIGVGLFARFFLDWFEYLCDQHGKDYYDRLCYVAADRSPKMLRDAGRHGIFGNHAGRYCLRVADAMCPGDALFRDPSILRYKPRPFRAVILNYVLDCLHPTVVKAEGGQAKQLYVRTRLPNSGKWKERLDANPDELQRLASSRDSQQRRELLAVYPFLLAEYEYRDVSSEDVPFGAFAFEHARQLEGKPILHNYGALRCLESVLEMLADGGVIHINDYGQTREIASQDFEHQRFSQARAVGLNFPLLGAFYSAHDGTRWVEPDEGEPGIVARLLSRNVAPATLLRFHECFGKKARESVEGPAQQARELARAGRLQAALGKYREALSRQPFSWVLMSEVSNVLNSALQNPKAALEMARAALEHNPACSADLWNDLGDALYAMGRVPMARWAYSRAIRINADVRGWYNLAFAHTSAREYREALVSLGEGLALDRGGLYRDRLLQKQAEVLTLLGQEDHRRALDEFNRVAGAGEESTSRVGPVLAQESPTSSRTAQLASGPPTSS